MGQGVENAREVARMLSENVFEGFYKLYSGLKGNCYDQMWILKKSTLDLHWGETGS